MRHFCLAGAVATLTRGMGATTRPAGLIALARRPERLPAGRLRTDRPAVALAAVTPAANQKLQTTTGTMAQTGQRQFHGHLRSVTKGPPGRRPPYGGYCRCNRARHGWGAAPEQIWRSGAGAAPAPSVNRFYAGCLLLSPTPGSGDTPRHGGWRKTLATGTPGRSRPAPVRHPTSCRSHHPDRPHDFLARALRLPQGGVRKNTPPEGLGGGLRGDNACMPPAAVWTSRGQPAGAG